MSNPDILIVSLEICFSGHICKNFRPKIKVILFIHREKDTQFDFIVTRIAIFSHELWFDSIASSGIDLELFLKN